MRNKKIDILLCLVISALYKYLTEFKTNEE